MYATLKVAGCVLDPPPRVGQHLTRPARLHSGPFDSCIPKHAYCLPINYAWQAVSADENTYQSFARRSQRLRRSPTMHTSWALQQQSREPPLSHAVEAIPARCIGAITICALRCAFHELSLVVLTLQPTAHPHSSSENITANQHKHIENRNRTHKYMQPAQ